jgi:hypothetical protein
VFKENYIGKMSSEACAFDGQIDNNDRIRFAGLYLKIQEAMD